MPSFFKTTLLHFKDKTTRTRKTTRIKTSRTPPTKTTKTKTVKPRNRTRTRTIGTTTDTFFLLDYQPGQGKGQPAYVGQEGQPQTHFFFWIINQDKEKDNQHTKDKKNIQHKKDNHRHIFSFGLPTRARKRHRTRTRTIGTTKDTFFLLDYQQDKEKT